MRPFTDHVLNLKIVAWQLNVRLFGLNVIQFAFLDVMQSDQFNQEAVNDEAAVRTYLKTDAFGPFGNVVDHDEEVTQVAIPGAFTEIKVNSFQRQSLSN